MLVRRLQNKEILEGLRLVWKVFAEANAPHMTPEGVASFQEFIKMENFMPKVESGEIAVFGAINGNELAGVRSEKGRSYFVVICEEMLAETRSGQNDDERGYRILCVWASCKTNDC